MYRITIQLKEFMKQNNLRQQDVAEKTGLKQSTVSEIANGRRDSINKVYMEKIINAYNINDLNKLIKIERV
jgi:putative transcriptional regulator